jgi:hypothetical protein
MVLSKKKLYDPGSLRIIKTLGKYWFYAKDWGSQTFVSHSRLLLGF